MSEFCAGVKILLERMESNPEDFEMVKFDMANDQGVQGRFYQFAQSMDDVILGKQNKDRPWRDWQYFTEEERQALIDGFKKMKRAKFDKEIMERVFDEQYIERQKERIRFANQPQYQAQQAAMHNAASQARIFTTTNTSAQQNMGAGFTGLGNIFK